MSDIRLSSNENTITLSRYENNINITTVAKGTKGDDGEQGVAGFGLITGGSTGQVLAKKTNEDYDTEWVDQTGGTGNGNAIVSYLYQYQYDDLTPDDNTFYVVDDSTPEIIYVTDVSLNKSSTTLVVGGTETLVATIIPSQATNKSVVWSSSDNNVATVSVNGLVTGITAGSATITVTTGDGNFVDTCSVTVSQDIIMVTGVSLNKSSTSINIDATETLTATIVPTNATNQVVAWSSSNESIATISSSGLITGISAGTATITVITDDGDYTDTCTVTVNANTVSVTGVSLNKSSTSITVDATETLTATVTPSNATNKSVTWTSSNTDVATVSSGGVVTGVSAGSATITVTTTDGNYTANCTTTISSSYPGLWQGERTQNGITATVTGNRVVLNGTKNNTDVSSGSAYYTSTMVSPNIFATTFDMWYTFKSGDQITLKCTYVSGTKSVSNANAVLCLRDYTNTILCTAATWSTTSGTVNYTFSTNKSCKGLLSYIDTNAVLGNFTFDIELTVNGVRWI